MTRLLNALRAFAATLEGTVRLRGQLFGVELREEIERRKQMLLLAVIGAVFLHMALVVLTFFVAVLFWDTHRIAALGAMALLYLALGAFAILRLRAAAAASPPPFAATLSELDKDLGVLRTPTQGTT
jgi:uncharacterized membrane protein YqjE